MSVINVAISKIVIHHFCQLDFHQLVLHRIASIFVIKANKLRKLTIPRRQYPKPSYPAFGHPRLPPQPFLPQRRQHHPFGKKVTLDQLLYILVLFQFVIPWLTSV